MRKAISRPHSASVLELTYPLSCGLRWISSVLLLFLASVPFTSVSSSQIDTLILSQADLTELTRTNEWQSLSREVDFLPALNLDQHALQQWAAQQLEINGKHPQRSTSTRTNSSRRRKLNAEAPGDDDIYRINAFVEGETEYDEYQTAWRLLGFMIDCDDDLSDAMLDDGDGGGSHDGGTGEGCHRYVIWAAYVDLNYEGGGIGEYQYWDRWNNQWNTDPCKYSSNGDGRCAKMDCHLQDTHWSLLGLFKHQSLDDWMEQLFKHEGVCVWTENEYDFMGDAREEWPDACQCSDTTTSSGAQIYYDVKPLSGGRITIGLYTDTRCVEEYVPTGSDDPITVENVVGNFLGGDGGDDSSSSLQSSLEEWDSALQAFRICQPCVAYDLNNVGYNADDDASKGSSYWTYQNGYDDNNYNGNANANGDDFDCYDDADYTNVNQCMKFMAKTEMNTASFRDIMLANAQETLNGNPLADYISQRKGRGWFHRRRGSNFAMYFWFLCSVLLLGYAYFAFLKIQRNTNYRMPTFQWNAKQPLVFA